MDTYEQADKLLDVLEKAPVGTPGALFRNSLAKQWMESCIIRAIKKLQAAEYHCMNINFEIQALHEAANRAAESFKGSGKMFTRGDKDEIAYELDAFLAATRACIDFVSTMLALHLKGMNRRTGSTSLLKKLNPTAPFGVYLQTGRSGLNK